MTTSSTVTAGLSTTTSTGALVNEIDPSGECTVLMSDAVEASLPAHFDRKPVGEIPLRGREAKVSVWQLG